MLQVKFSGVRLIPAIVDTCAETCVFPTEMLKRIVFDETGALPDFPQTDQIRYRDIEIEVVRLGRFRARVGFSDHLSGHGKLGFYGFLDRFDVTFTSEDFEITQRQFDLSG